MWRGLYHGMSESTRHFLISLLRKNACLLLSNLDLVKRHQEAFLLANAFASIGELVDG